MTKITRLACAVLASWVLACAPTVAVAADDSYVVGIVSLANDPVVAKELGLSEEVQKQLADFVTKRIDDASPLLLEIKDLDEAEQKSKLAPFVAESEKEGLKLLTAEQQTRLRQLRLQRIGMVALLEQDIADKLALTPQQRGKLDVQYQLHLQATAAVPEAERARAKIELEKKMLAMLTDEQRTAWEALEGRTGAVAQAAPAAPADQPADQPGDAAPGPAIGGPAIGASPRPGVGITRPGGNATLKPASEPLKAIDPNVKLKFQFRYAPWKDVIEWFAEQADYSLVSDVYPTGTFNYSDTRAYTPAQAIDLLNSVLITKGYRLIRRERMLFLLSSEDELPDTFAPRISEAELDKQGDFEIVQCQFQLTKVTAEEAEAEVKKLIGPQGKVVVLSKARQIVVTEAAGTLRLIRNAIHAIENPVESPKDEKVTIVKLENIRPTEFMSIARDLLGIPVGLTATPDGSLRISIDELGMRLLATGKPDKIEKLTELQKLIDVETVGMLDGEPLEQPQLIVYSVQNADPASVLAVLQTMLAGLPDVRISLDPKSGNLIALCRPSQHATIRALLEEMQKDATKFTVFKLFKNDPQSVALQINELFGGGEKGAANAPKVVADSTNLQISVRGSPVQIQQIEGLLKEMGELGGTPATNQTERQTVRVISNGTGRAGLLAVEQVEALFKATRPNKIIIHRPASRNTTGQPPSHAAPGTPGQPATGAPNVPRIRPLGEDYNQPPEPALDPAARQFLEEFGVAPNSVPPARTPAPAAPPPPTQPQSQPQPQPQPAPQPQPQAEPPAPAPAAPSVRPDTSSLQRRPHIHFVSQPGPAEEVAEKSDDQAAGDEQQRTQGEPPIEPEGPVSKPGADIVITMGPAGIIVASEDLDALDEIEAQLRAIVDRTASNKQFHIIYLKYAKAQVAATLLQELLSGSAASSSDSGGGSLMGDIASNMMGDMGGGLLGGLLGFGGGGGGGSAPLSAGSTLITPDIRLNALIVQASARDLDNIEQLIPIIDQPYSPENPQPVPPPRFIPVRYTTADAIAVVVRQVYAGRIAADASAGQQRQPSPEDLIRALRGGGRGRGGQQENKGEELKMTVGVDTRTNSLIVSAPDYLFEEVKALVAQLDVSELASDQIVRVVSLKSSNADVITRSLSSLYGDSITTTKTTTTGTTTTSGRPSSTSSQRSSTQGSSRGSQSGSQSGSQRGSQGSSRGQQQPSMQDLMNAMQRSGGSSRGGFGGRGR